MFTRRLSMSNSISVSTHVSVSACVCTLMCVKSLRCPVLGVWGTPQMIDPCPHAVPSSSEITPPFVIPLFPVQPQAWRCICEFLLRSHISEHSICLCESGLFHLNQPPPETCMLLQMTGASLPVCVSPSVSGQLSCFHVVAARSNTNHRHANFPDVHPAGGQH